MLFSCSGGDSPEPIPVVKNTAPTVPVLVVPANNKICLDNLVNFQWNTSVDAENDAISYQIQVARDNQFLQIVKTIDGPELAQNIPLDMGLAYYWRVKATDSKGLSSVFSPTYSFYTAVFFYCFCYYTCRIGKINKPCIGTKSLHLFAYI